MLLKNAIKFVVGDEVLPYHFAENFISLFAFEVDELYQSVIRRALSELLQAVVHGVPFVIL